MAAPHRSLEHLDASQVSGSKQIRFPLHDLDLVIMNAPFTDNRKRGRKFGTDEVKRMQRHELDIRDRLQLHDEAAARAISTNSVRTFFTPLAERLLNSESGILAKVLPATACVGAGGTAERRFLAERFHIERIVTSHDPQRIAFSENTSIHECLLICRRFPEAARRPTEFVSLRRIPESAEEAIEAADAISAGTVEASWGRLCLWPVDRVRAGDWTPVQWYDGILAEAALKLETNALLEPVGLRHHVGPAGRRIQDAYEVCDGGTPGAVPGFHSVSSKLRRTILGTPDVWYRPKAGKDGLASRYHKQRNHLLIPMRFDTVSGRLTGLWTPQRSFGWWVPVEVEDEDCAKALAVWWNTTPARLMLLNRRGRKLTYPIWQLVHLREIRIPGPDNPAWVSLRAAFDRVRNMELLPMRQAEECEVRKIIDVAAAQALGVELEILADWRRRLVAEPTITNARCDPS